MQSRRTVPGTAMADIVHGILHRGKPLSVTVRT
jgi:hypothetical protein